MSEQAAFWHENLHVYQLSVAFCSRVSGLIDSTSNMAATDHLIRASDSVPENIVTGNSSWSADGRRHYFSIAYGSTLECAACLDVLRIRGELAPDLCNKEKGELRRIVQMLVGLIQDAENRARETPPEWEVETHQGQTVFFNHEDLEVYRLALDFAGWVGAQVDHRDVIERYARKLDKLSTSVVLNIAEGNGRFGPSDHRKFVDIARQSALKSAVAIDLLMGKDQIDASRGQEGKVMLSRVAQMLLALRNYLQTQAEE